MLYIVINGELLCATASRVPSGLKAQLFPAPVGRVPGFVSFVYGIVVVSYMLIYGVVSCAIANRVPLGLKAQPFPFPAGRGLGATKVCIALYIYSVSPCVIVSKAFTVTSVAPVMLAPVGMLPISLINSLGKSSGSCPWLLARIASAMSSRSLSSCVAFTISYTSGISSYLLTIRPL